MRLIRNIVERAIMNQAVRVTKLNQSKISEECLLGFEEDDFDIPVTELVGNRQTIGF